METITFYQNIHVFYVTASSYPEGIMAAHEKIHAMVPMSGERKYFGISRPEQGRGIVYRAAAEEMQPEEGKLYHCDTLILHKGHYSSLLVKNYEQDIPAIGQAFEKLLALPAIDPEGYCVEWYINDKDVCCMVRMEAAIS
jgi:hypothetical protein